NIFGGDGGGVEGGQSGGRRDLRSLGWRRRAAFHTWKHTSGQRFVSLAQADLAAAVGSSTGGDAEISQRADGCEKRFARRAQTGQRDCRSADGYAGDRKRRADGGECSRRKQCGGGHDARNLEGGGDSRAAGAPE